MTGERLCEILKSAIIAYESELENQDYPSEEELHSVVLNEFGMTQEEYQSVMDGTAFATPRVLLLDWAANDEQGINVIGIFPDIDSAKKAFAENVQAERELAEENGWKIYEDTDTVFDAGYEGFYNNNHTTLKIEVNQ